MKDKDHKALIILYQAIDDPNFEKRFLEQLLHVKHDKFWRIHIKSKARQEKVHLQKLRGNYESDRTKN